MLKSTRKGIYPNQYIQASRYEYPGSLPETPGQAEQEVSPYEVLPTCPGFFLDW